MKIIWFYIPAFLFCFFHVDGICQFYDASVISVKCKDDPTLSTFLELEVYNIIEEGVDEDPKRIQLTNGEFIIQEKYIANENKVNLILSTKGDIPIKVNIPGEPQSILTSDEKSYSEISINRKETKFKIYFSLQKNSESWCSGDFLPIKYRILETKIPSSNNGVENSTPKPAQHQPPPPPPDPDEEKWKRISQSKDFEKYEEYLKEFPGGKYLKKAKDKYYYYKPLDVSLERQNGNYLFKINGWNEIPEFIVPDNVEIIDSFNFESGEILLSILDNQKTVIKFCDSSKSSKDRIGCWEFPLNTKPLEIVSISENNSNQEIDLHLAGGNSPYQIVFYFKNSDNDYFLDKSFKDSIFSINKKTLFNELKIAGTINKVEVIDKTGINRATEVGINIKIQDARLNNIFEEYSKYIIGGVLALFGLGILIRLISNKRRREATLKREKIQESRKETEQKKNVQKSANTINTEQLKIQQGAEKIVDRSEEKKEIRKDELADSHKEGLLNKADGHKIRIKNKKPLSTKYTSINELLKSDKHLVLNLQEHWSSSEVSKIHFGKRCIFEINDFIYSYNVSLALEQEEGVPEIGGMLLGAAEKIADSYEVSVDKFVPIRSKEDNVYRLEFDSATIANDLSDFLDDHPEYLLVGWFHTHPGHGLFLSRPDLRVQNGHFRKPFQFALEIDSLSEELDTAFFTWKKGAKEMNNANDRIPSKWFSWLEIGKFIRKKD